MCLFYSIYSLLWGRFLWYIFVEIVTWKWVLIVNFNGLLIHLFGSEILVLQKCTWFSGSWGFMTHYLVVDVELGNVWG